MKKIFLLNLLFSLHAVAQTGPEITSWIINTTGATGYNGIPSNVQLVQYSTGNVYVSCTCIPGYAIGPWAGNPNIPSNQNFVYKITRNPVQNTGTPVSVGLGHIGVWTNGVSIFNVSDGQSYNNQGIWNRNAYFWEGSSFDNCLGHPAGNGEYHHHVSPSCLYNNADSMNHSPIIGYAFDGFPVYGAYGYSNVNGTGGIKRMESSYVVTTSTTRINGPNMNATYPAGCFMEDYIYTAGSGDLDERNGRFCVTPEYPNGSYAYFVTIDDNLDPVFPYTFYGSYYGVVQTGNTGPAGGHVVISEPTTIYAVTGANDNTPPIAFQCLTNPAIGAVYLFINYASENNLKAELYGINGQQLQTLSYLQPGSTYSLNLPYQSGVYLIRLTGKNSSAVQRIVLQ